MNKHFLPSCLLLPSGSFLFLVNLHPGFFLLNFCGPPTTLGFLKLCPLSELEGLNGCFPDGLPPGLPNVSKHTKILTKPEVKNLFA